MAHSVCFIASLLLVANALASTSDQEDLSSKCARLSKYETEIRCEDLRLSQFPNFTGFIASSYNLNGNSFSRINNGTFPRSRIIEINILENDKPMVVDSNAFGHLSSALTVLRLQNVEFQFDGIFEPVTGLHHLNDLWIGSVKFTRNLSVPFLRPNTMNQLIWLRIVNSGIEDISKEVLGGEFKRLHFFGLNHNRLYFVPEGVKNIMRLRNRVSLEVDLSHNLMVNVQQSWFPKDCTITSLDLSHNKIRSIRLRALENCRRLISLKLDGNKDLLYISPALFPNNCHKGPRLHVQVQHTGIRNLEFSLRNCIRMVYYWNTSIPCNCRHRSLIRCLLQRKLDLYGNCLWRNKYHTNIREAEKMWNIEGCEFFGADESYNPMPLNGAGDTLASMLDWGECVIETTMTTTPIAPTMIDLDIPSKIDLVGDELHPLIIVPPPASDSFASPPSHDEALSEEPPNMDEREPKNSQKTKPADDTRTCESKTGPCGLLSPVLSEESGQEVEEDSALSLMTTDLERVSSPQEEQQKVTHSNNKDSSEKSSYPPEEMVKDEGLGIGTSISNSVLQHETEREANIFELQDKDGQSGDGPSFEKLKVSQEDKEKGPRSDMNVFSENPGYLKDNQEEDSQVDAE